MARARASGVEKAAVGGNLPDLPVQATGGRRFQLGELKGAPLVLYFYPKDNTPGCTAEGQDFRDRYARFRKLGATVYGVSRDRLATHEQFKGQHDFPFDLIADEDEALCRAFGVIKTKHRFGRTYQGVDRSTFVFDREGVLRKAFRDVKVAGHVEQVLEEIKKL